MIGLVTAVILFNLIAFTTNKRLNKNQIVHIWTFTIALQLMIDIYIDVKLGGYWYFTKSVDLQSIPAITVLIPPVNMIYLNWFPFRASFVKRFFYIACWVTVITCYEAIALLPEPWGYFHHGWWNLWYSAMLNPILLWIVLIYYKWICRI